MNEEQHHFKGKEAIGHVVEAQARGIAAAAESHGTEIPGHLSAASDAAKETALLLAMLFILFVELKLLPLMTLSLLAVFSLALVIWKGGRSAWLGWARLERLHRIVAQEKWEIDHHREQEREELKALYRAKGFEGKLLDDVIDVLMADGDRLLRVMVEEELGLTLGKQEHPLKQALSAVLATASAALVILLACWQLPLWCVPPVALVVVAISSAFTAKYESNSIIHAILWNLGLVTLSFSTLYFLMEYLV